MDFDNIRWITINFIFSFGRPRAPLTTELNLHHALKSVVHFFMITAQNSIQKKLRK